MSDWTDADWRAEADAWITGQLERCGREPAGEFDQIHDRPWSTVIQVPTVDGNVFFKAVSPPLRHEAALTEFLGSHRPDCVPPPLAVDSVRGWLLSEDGGQTLRELIEIERDLSRWRDVLSLYAGVQIDLMEHVSALLALGVPDFRLASMPAELEALLDEIVEQPEEERRRLRAMLPWVREACEKLAAAGLPETIQHDDLHDGQIFVRDDRYLLLDWGDACISHPFFTLAVTLDGVIAWGVDDVEGSEPTESYRDAYLEPFRQLTSGDLLDLSQTARRLGWACRALNSRRSQPSDESTTLRLRMFLDGRA